jgi:hypothetical protein
VEATSQLQANQELIATRSVHHAARKVRRWLVSSSCPMPAEGFLVAGRTIASSHNNRLASRIEADRCNQRTNINASGIRVRRFAGVEDYP